LLVFVYFQNVFHDAVTVFLASTSVACCFIAQWGFNDLTYFDGIAYFLMLLAMWTHRAIAIPFLLVLAGFTDERAIIAAPLIYLAAADWDIRSAAPSVRQILKPNRRKVAVLAGAGLFGILRLMFSFHIGHAAGDLSGIGTMPVRFNAPVLPWAILLLFKGSFLIPGGAALVILRLRAYGLAALLFISAAPGIVAAVLVYDLSRSLAYVFPCLFIGAKILAQSVGTADLRRLTMCAALGSVLMPTYYILLGLYPLLPAIRLF